MTINHHPAADHLVAYAAGTMSEAASVLIASHLTLCPRCRAETRQMEAVGGALLDDLPPASMSDGLAHMLKRLDDAPGPEPVAPTAIGEKNMLPRPLLNYLGAESGGRLPWQRILGIDTIPLKTTGRQQARLLRIPSGGGLPYHGHVGDELVLVLSGGFTDETGAYHRGDVAAADAHLTHTPITIPGEPCICIAVNEGPVLPGRLLAPLSRLFRRAKS
jgi:putative transcriptional regulator